MKIWILSSESPEFNPGGIARYVDNFARALAQRGHDMVVISRGETDVDKYMMPGYRLLAFAPRWNQRPEDAVSKLPDQQSAYPYNTLDYWSAVSFQFAEEVNKLSEAEGLPDVIETQEYAAIGYYLLQRQLIEPNFLPGVPVLVHLHSPEFILRKHNRESRYQLPGYWTGQMEKACIVAADALLAPSRFLADEIQELFQGDVEVKDIPLPFTDVSHLSEAPVESGDVVYIGRLEVRKGVLDMVQRCAQLWRRGERFRLTLIGGDCPYTPRNMSVGDYLRRTYAAEIEEGLLHLTGGMPQAELLERIRSAAVVCIPSIWENWPNTCMEAMSLGKVVVASVHGGQAAMLGHDDQAGFLFDWADPASFDRALLQALSLDESQRRERGALARRRIHGLCDHDRVVEQRIQHFQLLIQQGKRHTTRFPFVNQHLRDSQVSQALSAAVAEQGRLSVVIPYYNLGRYIDETLASVWASDYPSLEVVIVNDGSRDALSLAKLDELRKTDSFLEEGQAASSRQRVLRVLDIENGGLAHARNVGARAATGEFLAFVDADDAVEPTFFSRCIELIQRYENVQIAYSWQRYFDASNDIYPVWNFEFPYLLAHNMTAPLCVMQRSAFLAYGLNKRQYRYNFEDYECWLSMVEAGCGGVAIPEPLARYRIRKDSMWHGSSRQQHLYLYELLLDGHAKSYQQYGPDLFGLQNANGSAQTWSKPSDPSPYDTRLEWFDQRENELWELAEARWHEIQARQQELAGRDEEIAWLRSVVANHEKLIASLYKERDWLRGLLAESESRCHGSHEETGRKR